MRVVWYKGLAFFGRRARYIRCPPKGGFCLIQARPILVRMRAVTTLAGASPVPRQPTRKERWADFGERVAWTAIQALGGATITVLATDVDWKQGLIFVGITTLLAVAKVGAAQQFGSSGLGDIRPES